MAKYELVIYMKDNLIRNSEETFKEFFKALGGKNPKECKVTMDYKLVTIEAPVSTTLGAGLMKLHKEQGVDEICIKNHPNAEKIKEQPILKLMIQRGILEVV